ncbi:helix-turn-helix domain-containing protein [Desulfoscipio geothermicus]|uniref:Helix-turn-helix n=1 Tax=Desulfoscipio geothermicus DSM 3669 TaxID=1121426 RepID=A0A1I6D4T9_9FIRM|nr:Helix-turn-helix [Desulfoscipio geothermicus DSM 3669]
MIGLKIKQLREQQNFSLRRLAQITGLSHGFLCDIEHGRCNPSIKTLTIIANALRVKPEFILSNLDTVGTNKKIL